MNPASRLAYSLGHPTKIGVYACRVSSLVCANLLEDKFLMWCDERWWYVGSDQAFRGAVQGWLGPLPRTKYYTATKNR
jgi:hypothetical protein